MARQYIGETRRRVDQALDRIERGHTRPIRTTTQAPRPTADRRDQQSPGGRTTQGLGALLPTGTITKGKVRRREGDGLILALMHGGKQVLGFLPGGRALGGALRGAIERAGGAQVRVVGLAGSGTLALTREGL